MSTPDEYTEPQWLGWKPGAPFLAPQWGDLIDPELIHDYVFEGDDE